MTRDEIILWCREESESEDADFWNLVYAIADLKTTEEEEKNDPNHVPWSERDA